MTDDGVVDVRPGGSATFDGDRVRLALLVFDADRYARVPWWRFADLEDTATAFLRRRPAAVLRFGDRAACRAVLGTAAVEAIERRLADAARTTRTVLVTWSREECPTGPVVRRD